MNSYLIVSAVLWAFWCWIIHLAYKRDRPWAKDETSLETILSMVFSVGVPALFFCLGFMAGR